MELSLRKCQNEDDYWRIRNFLRQVLIQNNNEEKCWHIARLDYWRWHVVRNGNVLPCIDDYVFIWETKDGEMAAVLNPESHREAFL